MTEQEWLACTDPTLLLQFVRGKFSDRKLRLFAVACCRRIWQLIDDDRSRQAIVIAEEFADGRVGAADLVDASMSAQAVADGVYESSFDTVPSLDPDWGYQAHEVAVDASSAAYACTSASEANRTDVESAVSEAAQAVAHAAEPLRPESAYRSNTPQRLTARTNEIAAQAALFHDIIGNPFHPVTADSSWLTASVLTVAHAIYDDRCFEESPILADALEDAGCTHATLLDHLRSPGPHVRGCWALDAVLRLK